MKALIAALVLSATSAGAQSLSPFLPAPTAPSPVDVLAPADFLDRAVVEAVEAQTGATVALDGYAGAAELADRLGERRYDLVVLRGPALARRLGTLARLDRRRLPNARFVQPVVAAKLAAYDREGAFAVAFGWTAFGLLYDADKARAAPNGWAMVFGGAKEQRRLGECGIVWPDAREESFIAAWRFLGVDPARAQPAQVKPAGAVLERARGTFVAFAAPDEVGAFAKGAACLGAGTAGEATAVASRGGDATPNVRFAYPREGAPLALYAYAIPADAPAPDAAYRLLDALLAPDNARRDAASGGVNGAEDPLELETLKRLAPEPVFDPALMAAMQAEWKRLTSAK